MRITRKPLARVLTGGFALAAATALVLPGVAAADDTNKEGTTTEDSSGSGSSSGSLDKLPIPKGVQGFVTAMQKIATGEIDIASIGDCVTDAFGKDDPGNDPISIIINCIVSSDEDASADKNDKDKVDETKTENVTS